VDRGWMSTVVSLLPAGEPAAGTVRLRLAAAAGSSLVLGIRKIEATRSDRRDGYDLPAVACLGAGSSSFGEEMKAGFAFMSVLAC